MQPALKVKPVVAAASDLAETSATDKGPKSIVKWVVSTLLVAIIPIVTAVIESRLSESNAQKLLLAQKATKEAQEREAFFKKAANLLFEIDESLRKTTDTAVLARWNQSNWDRLENMLANLRSLYFFEIPDTPDQSIAASLQAYSEFVGETWRGSGAYNRRPESTRRKNYQDSARYLSEARTALSRYHSGDSQTA